MYRICIFGGETHIGEIASLRGSVLEVVGVCVKPEQIKWTRESFATEMFADLREMLAARPLDVVAVANENREEDKLTQAPPQ